MVRLTDRPDMTLDVYRDVKQQYNNNKFYVLRLPIKPPHTLLSEKDHRQFKGVRKKMSNAVTTSQQIQKILLNVS